MLKALEEEPAKDPNYVTKIIAAVEEKNQKSVEEKIWFLLNKVHEEIISLGFRLKKLEEKLNMK